jgi:hypothetical protein
MSAIRLALLGFVVALSSTTGACMTAEDSSNESTDTSAAALRGGHHNDDDDDCDPNNPSDITKKVLKRIAGLWSLTTYYVQNPDGTQVFPFGPTPSGQILINENGVFATSFQNPARVNCVAPLQANCTAAEVYPALWRGYITGNANLQPIIGDRHHWQTGRLFLKYTQSLMPNQVGTITFRDYIIDGNTMTLSLPSSIVPGSAAVVILNKVNLPPKWQLMP